jgi:glucans biosynthesis protein C
MGRSDVAEGDTRLPGSGGAHVAALDSSRALLMLLGLVVHAAAPYRGSGSWLVDDAAGLESLGLLSAWISTFRMPAFFLLAGLLSAWALGRRSGAGFLSRRATRLLLPLAASALTLNALQHAWLAGHAADECLPGAVCAVSVPAAPWLGHLWFLLDLFVYTALLVVVAPSLPRIGATLERWLATLARAARLPLAIAAAALACFAWSLAIGVATLTFDVLDRPFLGFWYFSWVADHLFFFAAGAVLAALPAFRARLAAPPPISVVALAGLAGTLAFMAREALPLHRNSLAGKIAFEFAETVPTVLLTVFAVAACLRLHRWIGHHAARLARWSYSIYLTHHLVVVAVALVLLEVELPPIVKFAVTLASAAMLSTLAAAIIERSRVLTWLFNGESRPPLAKPAGQADPSPRESPQSATAAARVVPSDLDILETEVPGKTVVRAAADADAADRLAG